MLLDSNNFSQIEELQSIQEENLLPVSEISYQYESDSNYAGDVSFWSEKFENFDEILSESEIAIVIAQRFFSPKACTSGPNQNILPPNNFPPEACSFSYILMNLMSLIQ
ncbi:hypothetical protein Glove_117g323 [Diversispora epigaea]|uniref:Uncharacterized protein n=1 Tax=Diversispora epigaea TaxID=1348612 RepID=A0A397J6W1_9GLOM|nr:hypothetical protein Glove_117g323 [Diversispora epigaea]